jgi:hypothetical protein
MSHLVSALTSIAADDLRAVAGGASRDPGDDYVKQLKSDLTIQGSHEHGAVDAARSGNWLHAGGETLRAGVDGLKTGEDSAAPLKPVWNFVKDAAGIFGSLRK